MSISRSGFILFVLVVSGKLAFGELTNPQNIDSLLNIAISTVNDTGKVKALYHLAIYYRRSEPQKALNYGEEALALSRRLKWKKGEADCLKNLGNTYHLLTDYPKERECFERSLKIFEEIKDTLGIGKCLNNIGITYYYLSDFSKALDYYQKSLAIMEKYGNKQGIANSLNNIGGVYNSEAKFDKALEYDERTLKIKQALGDKTGIAICLTNIGNVHKNLENYSRALHFYEESLKISESIKDKPGIAGSYRSIGDIYCRLTLFKKALDYLNRSYALAKEMKILDIQRDALKNISETWEKLGKYKESLKFYTEHIKIKDSIINVDKLHEIAVTGIKIQYERKHVADSVAFQQAMLVKDLSYKETLHQKNNQRNGFIFISSVVLVISVGLYNRLRYSRRSKIKIQKEKDRTENLLMNILPAEIAQELKEKGQAEARDFDEVSVLFADIEDFTRSTELLSAHDLVAEINICFGAFDGICGEYKVEKVKTIGDSYMAAGGIPVPFPEAVKNTVNTALKMQEYMINRKIERTSQGLTGFGIRLGIHTGPVVAGIVGIKKFHYDIWGDTVNTASRMESSGTVGRVNISRSTYECLKDDPDFTFEYRGKVVAKNKGEMDMYYVERS